MYSPECEVRSSKCVFQGRPRTALCTRDEFAAAVSGSVLFRGLGQCWAGGPWICSLFGQHRGMALAVGVGVVFCSGVAAVHAVAERCCRPCSHPSSRLHPCAKAYTALYALASAVGAIAAAVVTWPHLHVAQPHCGALPVTFPVAVVLFAYFVSKLVEATDLVLVTLRGFPIATHFRVHHYTTPLFGWLGLVSRSHHGAVFMLLNLVMHGMVYAFHAGCHSPLLKAAIRCWQYVQLCVGVALSGAALASKLAARGAHASASGTADLGSGSGAVPAWLACGAVDDSQSVVYDGVPMVLFATYFVLFQLELREEARVDTSADSKKQS